VEFVVEGRTAPQLLAIAVRDHGPGITELPTILGGEYRSRTGLGLGLIGAKRLMDALEVETSPTGGTVVTMRKVIPWRGAPVMPAGVAAIAEDLARYRPPEPLAEVMEQNQELLRTLEELRHRQEELERLSRELEDTNRGVVALYAELDDRADHLRRADELKSKFLSNMSHEFRTPLNSILALSRLLLDHVDGPLSEEQTRQVAFVRKAAEDLSDLVNDLLDLAKVEAGKVEIRRRTSTRRSSSARCAGCCDLSWWPTPWTSCSTNRTACRNCTPTRARSRRSCATSSPTPSSSPSAARCAFPRASIRTKTS